MLRTTHHIQTLQRMTRDELKALVASGFDESHYLNANPDVRASPFSALDHYLEYGWLEGRMPSMHFAACSSLFDRTELQAIGVDPFALFLLVRATSQPSASLESGAARNAEPLASYRMQGLARYAASLIGDVDWSGAEVNATHDSPYRASAARLRLAFLAYVGRPIVVLPDQEWSGALSIARALDERHVAFLHFGNEASAAGWRAALSNIVVLPSAITGKDHAESALLLIDVLRGVAPPLLVDLGARAVRDVLASQGALLTCSSPRVVAFVVHGETASLPHAERMIRVTVLPAGSAVTSSEPSDDMAIDASALSSVQSRDFVARILAHGI